MMMECRGLGASLPKCCGRRYRWGNHRRPVFALVPVGDRHVLSVSMDRSVVLWRLETWDVEWSPSPEAVSARSIPGVFH